MKSSFRSAKKTKNSKNQSTPKIPSPLPGSKQTLASALAGQDVIIHIAWNHLKRFALLSILAGQIMVVWFFHEHDILFVDLSSYLVVSLEVFVTAFVFISTLTSFLILPFLYFYGILGIRNDKVFGILTIAGAIFLGWMTYLFANDNWIVFIVATPLLSVLNGLFYYQARKITLDAILLLQFAIPVIVLLLYMAFPFIQNSVMSYLRIMEHPYLVYISDKSPTEKALRLFCRSDEPVQEGFYSGYKNAELIYDGSGYYYITLKAHGCDVSRKISKKYIVTKYKKNTDATS